MAANHLPMRGLYDGILSGVGDRISHACETTLVDQIYDHLHIMYTLEVCISGIVTSLNQSLETSLHQSTYSATQNCLLTEQIGLGLLGEGGLDGACTQSAQSLGVSQAQRPGLAVRVLLDGNDDRDATASGVLTGTSALFPGFEKLARRRS